MKILIIAMRSIHTIRWVSQLKDSGHDVHWFDILNGGYIPEWEWVTQHTNWRYKFGNFKGRYFIKRYIPRFHRLFENSAEQKFNDLLDEIQPDVVHSFVMYNCTVPLITTMKKNKHIKWIYSAWGNDLYYYRNIETYKKDILKALPHLNYMFADCHRDIQIAKEMGFKGGVLGVFPGGGGYDIERYDRLNLPIDQRNIILIKGYEQRFGKAINVVLALKNIQDQLQDFKVIVFGADDPFNKAFSKMENIDFIEIKQHMNHNDVLSLMGESLIYIGNSISDGMPNTLLEAIIMGAFPIQSNPGGATEEIIQDNVNGFLIENPESIEDIQEKVLFALSNENLLNKARFYNKELRETLEYEYIRNEVLKAYDSIILRENEN
ncbi:glycosyltransferase family 4 protein [Gelidibacter gilvus]|uniref:Glycosyltransferase n=1 Tax=Gelidibacter gilvus TaxID=59602 RepID=A0A4Q0XBZ2_9FLAO|nr:glycosyltransferase family 4 protein [Gelidibacter gilvus]RXJ45402.1 glycosyltransferase [Gelidibacter gilvus]